MKALKTSTIKRYSDLQLRRALIKRAGYHPDILRIFNRVSCGACYKYDSSAGAYLFYCVLDRDNTIELLNECEL